MSGGVLYALLAYGAWGLVPLYWKMLSQVPAVEVLCHRIVWSMVLLLGLVVLQQRQSELHDLGKSPRAIAALVLTTIFVSLNWGIFIYSVSINRVVEASLGYYINHRIGCDRDGQFCLAVWTGALDCDEFGDHVCFVWTVSQVDAGTVDGGIVCGNCDRNADRATVAECSSDSPSAK
jgi:uncharacterized membrane protein